ncbi:MAG: M48 family metallopeptidase [Gammaproteobacteria bacterium]|nr:M48 family metallopeptidase [Gammaproteobacteria bacterium]
MDFYQAQDDARRSTTRLIVYFILAVISLVIMTNLLIMLVFGYVEGPGQLTLQNIASQFDWMTFFAIGALVVLIIAVGSAYKILTLAGGGNVVAESLGGTPIKPNTGDALERKVLNVVEEMAIASGTPVPPVYLLKDEEGINAFAAGNTPADAVIGITRGTAEQLTRAELQGVVAHEFSHILNGDMRMNIRLIGVLHGILVIGMIGYYVLRSMTYSRRRSNEKNGAPILALAIGLMVIGFAGTFFGNLIKASVSRNREFLADASAVQYTRDPHGIAGALKKIGGHAAGSTLQTPQAPTMSHAFFGQGVSHFIQSLFATHPPLDVRIKRVDPGWDGKFPAVEEPVSGDAARQSGGENGDERRRAVLEGAVVAAGVLQANEMIDSVGRPQTEHIQYAGEIIAAIPRAVREAAAEPYGARAVVYCLLLDSEREIRAQQLAHLEREGDHGIGKLVHTLCGDIAALGVEARLPLVDLAMPALRELSPGQYGLFRRNLDALIRMDRRINLFEWALEKILLQNLEPQFTGRRPRAPRHGSLGAVRPHVETLLSLLAHACVKDEQARPRAFEAARLELDMPDLELAPKERIDLDALDTAVDELALLKPLIKPRLLKACLACITHDEAYSPEEMELMRALADTLDCPMPPYLGGRGQGRAR